MCGLVGMVGFLEPHKHKAVMRDLLFLDTLRGRDSTGLSCVKRDKSVATRKLTVPGYDFIEYPMVDKAMQYGDQVWMGHNRFKTTGDVSKANAHPFEVCDDEDFVLLVGAHNGTLNNKWDIENAITGRPKFDTDSEALFNLFVDKATFKDAAHLLKGAWSLTFWDPTTDCFHFLRNSERPMTYAWTKDHKVLIYASEPWMIINAARRNGVELQKDERGMSCAATLPDHLYTLRIPQGRDQALPDITREGGYTGAPVKPFQWQGQRSGAFDDDDWWGMDENNPNSFIKPARTEEVKTEASQTEEKGKANSEAKTTVTIGYPDYKGYKGEGLTVQQFDNIKKKGCVWCGDKFDKAGKFAFITEDSMVCGNCLNDTHPKDGDRVRLDYDPLIDPDEDFDDPLPADLGPAQANSPEGRKLIAESVKKAIG